MDNYLKFVFLTLVSFGGFTDASIGRFLPFSGFQPIPADTPGPIDIEVSEVTNITTPPLIFLVNKNEKGILKNTGYSVEIYSYGNSSAKGKIGGVLGWNYYVFQKFRFYWAGEPRGVAGTTVNSENGTPLEMCAYYYNMKYGSFRNALKFRNGIVEVIFGINVGSIPNPSFDGLAAQLERVREPGTRVELNITDSFSLNVEFPPTSRYFVYPSAHVNQTTGRQHFCVTTIVAPLNPSLFISEQQFNETFLSLLNYKRMPMVNTVEQVPSGGRTVVQSVGIINLPNFVKVLSRNY